MKKIRQIAIGFMMIGSLQAQTLNGRYEGAVSRDGSIQLLNFELYTEEGIQKGTYEIP